MIHGCAGFDIGSTPAGIAASYAANWAVADWYLDGTIGDDANNGTTALTPLKTGAELARRLGPYALWGQSVTVHILGTGIADGLILRGSMLVAGTHCDVLGHPTLLIDSGTVAAYQAANHATPTASQLKTTGIADWAPYQWARLRFTSGTAVGAIAWIARSNPAGVGADVARISRPYRINAASLNTMPQSVVPAPGDAVLVESIPSVPSLDIQIDGPCLTTNVAAFGARQLYIEGISSPQMALWTPSLIAGARCVTFGCELGCQLIPPAQIDLGGMSFNNISALVGYADPGYASIGYCNTIAVMSGGLVGKRVVHIELMGSNAALFYTLFQNVHISTEYQNASKLTGIQIFDITNATKTALVHTGRTHISDISGDNNAGWGFSLYNGCVIKWTGTINLKGAVADAKFGTAPSTDLTQPQIWQASDYAQSGVSAAMAAGVGVVVTVPWYDNVSQKVTATHATFAGTPGALMVDQFSSTQFLIKSSDALDTSTVNWQISPLGRNIFISAS